MPHVGNRKSDFCQICLQWMNTSIDCKTNEFSMLSLSCVFFCHSSVCVALVCMCASDLFVCVYAYCVCPCLFCLAVPTVLARKRSPPPRADPGGVCLGRPGGGHHQQNIPDLQRSAGTATPRGIMLADGAEGRSGKTSKLKMIPIRMPRLVVCCPLQPVCAVTVHLALPTHMPACPFKLCRVILFCLPL